jgi:hypothetical protein
MKIQTSIQTTGSGGYEIDRNWNPFKREFKWLKEISTEESLASFPQTCRGRRSQKIKKEKMQYEEFLQSKIARIVESGFDVKESQLSPFMFPFQSFIVKRALKIGKFAIWADCGLGKSLMQLSWAEQVYQQTGHPVLILAPFAVVGQTIQEGEKFNIKVERASSVYAKPNDAPIQIANYEQLQNIDTSIFYGVVCDESGILKNFEGQTKKLIVDTFAHTPYKLCCTATPSPNDVMELGNHAEMLNVASRNEMLAQYFVHDGGETAKWRLKKHAEKQFWQWVSTWAIMLSKPADIGFKMTGYDLPPLNLIERQITTPQRENGQLFNDVAVSATNFNAELRLTAVKRLDEVAGIVNGTPDEPFLIWVKQDAEADQLKKLILGAIEVRGTDKPEYKESKLLGFARGEFRVLITKTRIASFGLNYQHCRNQVFASLDFSFEQLYQGIRRSYRFGQKNEVNIYMVTTDTMQNVIQSINNKQKQFEIMQKEMSEAVNAVLSENALKIADYDTEEVKNEYYHIKRGDCVQLIKEVPDESVGFSIFSPPFAELYTYSSHLEDMGNSKDYKEFLTQFSFLVKELYRVLKTGRNVAVHCMDLPIQKGKEGYIGLRDFSGMLNEAFSSEGFVYHSRVTIWKDPVVEMQRTKALGLLHKQVKKDATRSRVGIPDYLMIFRKDGEAMAPVKCDIPVDLWQKYASPVWMDINYSDTLQFRGGRDDKDEKHICPLQLPTIERAIHLYTNKGDTVLTPFMGIGSEVYQAVKMERYGVGFELKESYFSQAKKNIKSAVAEKAQISLFDNAEQVA